MRNRNMRFSFDHATCGIHGSTGPKDFAAGNERTQAMLVALLGIVNE
jgi:hypothetical protein